MIFLFRNKITFLFLQNNLFQNLCYIFFMMFIKKFSINKIIFIYFHSSFFKNPSFFICEINKISSLNTDILLQIF